MCGGSGYKARVWWSSSMWFWPKILGSPRSALSKTGWKSLSPCCDDCESSRFIRDLIGKVHWCEFGPKILKIQTDLIGELVNSQNDAWTHFAEWCLRCYSHLMDRFWLLIASTSSYYCILSKICRFLLIIHKPIIRSKISTKK